MLNADAVIQFNQELAETKVLSVYLNGEETDPAVRRAWRVRLNGMLRDLYDALKDAPEAERRAAQRSADLLDHELDRHEGLLPGRGWVGFATPERVWHAAPTPAPMPNLVRWEDGAHVAPYLRALKQSRPITAVVADRRSARILRYLHGELSEQQVIRSDAALPDSLSAGSSKRASTHSGARGEPRGDALRRNEEVSTQRMVRDVVELVTELASSGHLLVLAGSSETSAAVLKALPQRVRDRTIELTGISADATIAELAPEIDAAASALSIRAQRALVDEILDVTRSAGRACLGREPTERALDAGAVDVLAISRAFVSAHPEVAERLVDRALEQGAAVEEIATVTAQELDREGGVGARLRFTF